MEWLSKNKSKSLRKEQKDEMKKLRDERIRAHKATLSADQAKKYDELQAKKEARQNKRGHEGCRVPEARELARDEPHAQRIVEITGDHEAVGHGQRQRHERQR